jgi:argininosuccinate synthase
VLFPEYISIFSASFKKDNDWGAIAALGTQQKSQNIVIKFFRGHNNEIVYKSNNYDQSLEKANELSTLLGIRVHDAIKNSST